MGLFSGRTYRVVESCERSEDRSEHQRDGSRLSPIYLEGRSYWNNLFTSNSLHSTRSTLLFSLPSFYDTHTQLLQKSNWKNWGLWKWAKPGLLEAPMPQCILKHHCVADAVPPACRSSNFNWHIISNDNKAQESFRPKCRTSRVFHTRWMRLPRRRHSVSLSARVTDRCQNTGAQFCSPSRERERDWEGFSFYLLIIIIPPFLLLQTHSN